MIHIKVFFDYFSVGLREGRLVTDPFFKFVEPF
jgi:hypothetical protein